MTWGGAWGLLFLLGLPRRAQHVTTGSWQFWLNGMMYGLPPALVEVSTLYSSSERGPPVMGSSQAG